MGGQINVARSVLPGVSGRRRRRALVAVIAGTGAVLLTISSVNATDNAWVVEDEVIGGVVDSELAEDLDGNDCDGVVGIPGGLSPGWVRVDGDPNPHAAIAEVSGQILDPQAYVNFSSDDALPQNVKTNQFVTHTDNSFNHFARDINVFLTIDPADRHHLAKGNFIEGDSNEIGHMEVEWERGGVPMFAFPAMGDRMTVWGPHIWDCGHGDTWVELEGENDDYRTEIHPPMGWVMFRHSADADGVPDGNKQTENPWQWYHASDNQGQAAALSSSGLLSTNVQATVADAYFTTYGGNVIESLNGCDDPFDLSLTCYDYDERPELSQNEDIDSWEWHSPILDNDYSFVVPAPPTPDDAYDDVEMIWDVESRCEGVPPDPTFPNKADHQEAVDEVEGLEPFTLYQSDRPIGAATCNPEPDGASPYVIEVDSDANASWNDTGRPAIRFTLRAKTGADGVDGNDDDPVYPSNDYLSFAYRVKVAWDYAPPADDRARSLRVDFDTLRVYDDGEPCADDGEWIISLRVNDQYIHPVEGTVEDDNDSDSDTEPFWEDEAIDDALCDGGDDDDYKSYEMGTDGAPYLTRYVTALAGDTVELWERAYDKDSVSADDLSPAIREFKPLPPPGGSSSYSIGVADDDVEMSHTIEFNMTDITPPTPANGTLTFGDPQFGPDTELTDFTDGHLRVSGETPVTFDAPSATGFEYRIWPEGEALPAWQFDMDTSDGLTIDLPDDISCTCVIEFASIEGSGATAVVSVRDRVTIQLDNEPPVLTVPDDFEVYANQTAGAKVEYAVSATDNFPGPIEIVCAPGSGTIFPNGANAPLITTVDCTATDTVDNQSADAFGVKVTSPVGYVNDYALLGRQWLDIGSGTTLESGNAGAFEQSTGIPGLPGVEVLVAQGASAPTNALVAGHSVVLGNGVSVGEVLSVEPIVAGAGSTFTPRSACDPDQVASTEKCAYVPLWSTLPTFVDPGPVGINKTIKGTSTLAPGNYGLLELRSNAVLNLAPGSYSFTSVELKPGSRLNYSGATIIRINGRLVVGSATGAFITATAAAEASDLVIYVKGTDIAPNRKAVDIAPGAVIEANVYAPNGTILVRNGANITGAMIGLRIDVGNNVNVTHDSAFFLP